jgi:hypothetical protein
MAISNPLAGIQFASGSNLTTDVDKLDFNGGAIKAATGLIDGYMKQKEDERLANFENAKKNFELEGNTAGLEQLATYANTGFRDVANRKAASTSALGSLSGLEAFKLQSGANAAKEAGDLTGFNAASEGVKGSRYLDPTKKSEILNTLYPQASVLKVGALSKDTLNNVNPTDIFAVDKAVKKFRQGISALNLSPEESEKQISSFEKQALGQYELGTQAKGVLQPQLAVIDDESKLQKEALKARFASLQKFTEPQIKELAETASYDSGKLVDYINSKFEPGNIYSSNAEGAPQIKREVARVSDTKFIMGEGIPNRKPHPSEIKKALDLLVEDSWFAEDGKLSLNSDRISKTLVGIMRKNPTGVANLPTEEINQINNYYQGLQTIDANNTAKKLATTSAVYGGAGIKAPPSFKTTSSDTPVAGVNSVGGTTMPVSNNPTGTGAPTVVGNTSTTNPNTVTEVDLKSFSDNFKKRAESAVSTGNVGNIKNPSGKGFKEYGSVTDGFNDLVGLLDRYMTKPPATESNPKKEPLTSIKAIVDSYRPASDRRGSKDVSQENYYKNILREIPSIYNITGTSDKLPNTVNLRKAIARAIVKQEHGVDINTLTQYESALKRARG